MARPKKMEESKMEELVIQYSLQKPNIEITFPDLALYFQSNGYDVEVFWIRRQKNIRKLVEEINAKLGVVDEVKVSTWVALDIDKFLKENHTKAQLKKALMTRDTYYNEVATSAGKVFKESKKKDEKIKELADKISKLENKLSLLQNLSEKVINRQSKAVLVKMNQVLKTYVYADLATEILHKEGLEGFETSYVNPKAVDENLIKPNSELNLTDFEQACDLSENETTADSAKESKEQNAVDELMEGFENG